MDASHDIWEFLHRPLVQYYISVALVAVPVARIFRRAGFSLWPILFLAFPWVGYVFCAAWLALRRWPALKNPPAPKNTAEAAP